MARKGKVFAKLQGPGGTLTAYHLPKSEPEDLVVYDQDGTELVRGDYADVSLVFSESLIDIVEA